MQQLWRSLLKGLDSRPYATSAVVGALIAAIAVVDWRVQPDVSLGALYVLPILLAASVASRIWQVLALAVLCGILREAFDPVEFHPARLAAVIGAYGVGGLFVLAMNRNRRMTAAQLGEREHHLAFRQQADEQLRILMDTSPLAILILDGRGRITRQNGSARTMLGASEGEDIGRYLDVLASPTLLRPGVRTQVECRGRRKNGDLFLAYVWCSAHLADSAPALTAVVWDASENLRDREAAAQNSMTATSRVLVGALAHELRNLASAAALLHGNIAVRNGLSGDRDFQALGGVLQALEQLAASGLRLGKHQSEARIDLTAVLDEVRLLLGPMLSDCDAELLWNVPDRLPPVIGEHHALLQVFINLTKNACAAMQSTARRELAVHAESRPDERVILRFSDTGPGVAHPDRLFRAFESSAGGAGLGLYLSRAILQSFGGDLRYEPADPGAVFVLELRADKEMQGSGK